VAPLKEESWARIQCLFHQFKKGRLRRDSSNSMPALYIQSPEFKTQFHKKRRKEKLSV
jgi:hypothetical protein